MSDLLSILACPDCGGEMVRSPGGGPVCRRCARTFVETEDGILCLLPRAPKPLPPEYDDPDYRRMSAHFDAAQSYFTDGNTVFHAIHASSHRRIGDWMAAAPTDGWICDIGCGQGFHFPFFRGDPRRLVGVDLRIESLRRCRALSPDIALIQADFTRLPFRDGAFGAAFSIYALEHVYHLDDACREIARILATGRRLYVGLPCEGGLAWTIGRKLTSERAMSRRFALDYAKYIRLEHCNTARAVTAALAPAFSVAGRALFPLPFLPAISFNLTLSLSLIRR